MNWFRKQELNEADLQHSREKSLENPRVENVDLTAAVINNGEDHGLWEQLDREQGAWERNLRKLVPLVTAERGPRELD